MLTAGETWVSYMGVPDEYPDIMQLSREIDDAMWEAASEVLRERLAENPVLRALTDDRYRLWELVDGVSAGSLPPGIEIVCRTNHHIAKGIVRAPRESLHPIIYVNVDWGDERGYWTPTVVRLDDLVQAWLPVPLDVSALIAVVAAERNQPAPRPPRRLRARPVVDWRMYGACTRRGCWAPEGAACIDVRSRWSDRERPSTRPHPGRPRLAVSEAIHA